MTEGFQEQTEETSRSWCNKTADLPGYTSIHNTGVCADVVGRGNKTDYCRTVQKGEDVFVACDLNSKGGYSYWFRSPSSKEGWEPLEVPYTKDIQGQGVQSYCGVIGASQGKPARSACYNTKGLGFAMNSVPDSDPPEIARLRLRTYESLLEWYPLHTSPQDEGEKGFGKFSDKIRNKNIHLTSLYRNHPSNTDYRGITIYSGTPSLQFVEEPPINESNAISIMFKPINDENPSQDIPYSTLFFSGDAPYLNEFSIIVNNKNAVFSLYDGKANVFNMTINGVIMNEWNHLVLQYRNGYWEAYMNEKQKDKKSGPRHSFIKRKISFIGKTPSGSTTTGFNGSVADIRFYSVALDNTAVSAIQNDFNHIQVKESGSIL